MNIVVAGFSHESNTFNPILTTEDDFTIIEGDELLEYFPLAIEEFVKNGATILPYQHASCNMPGGIIAESFFRNFVEKIIERLNNEKLVDGIWLHLHGAIYVEHIGSGELYMLRRIREVVGKDVVIGVAMDPHGNLSPDITEYADIIRSYHTAPHIDQQETYRSVARTLVDFIRRNVTIKPAFVRLPMLLCGDTALTRDEPLKSIITRLKKLEEDERFVAASFFISMHSANTENTYPAVVIVPSKPQYYDEALVIAREIAEEIYARRDEFKFEGELVSPENAVEMAYNSGSFPVIISDSGDNTTAGATGMNTYLLKLFLEFEQKEPSNQRILISSLHDPSAYEILAQLDIGDRFHCSIGTGIDNHSCPVEVSGIIKSKGEVLSMGSLLSGVTKPIGNMVTISTGNIDISICNKPDSLMESIQCCYGNYNFNDYDIVVVKQAYQFPFLVDNAKMQLIALTQGATYQDLKSLKNSYTKLPWTIWPFQTDL